MFLHKSTISIKLTGQNLSLGRIGGKLMKPDPGYQVDIRTLMTLLLMHGGKPGGHNAIQILVELTTHAYPREEKLS